MDDKCGFKPSDWKHIYDYLISTKYKPNKKWSTKYIEKYHK